MALTDYKLDPETAFAGYEISSLADRPSLSATELKERFDANVKDVFIPTYNNLIDALEVRTNQWVATNYTWTRTGTNTFTVPANVTGYIYKDTKIKLTQTTVKYFYVLNATYSSPNTTVTVSAGATYSLADATITSPYFSNGNPPDFPGSFSLGTPAWTTNGTAFTNQPINNAWYFELHNRICTIFGQSQCHATSGGTGAFIATFTSGYLPAIGLTGYGHAVNGSSFNAGVALCSSNNTISLGSASGSTLATNSEYFGGQCPFKY